MPDPGVTGELLPFTQPANEPGSLPLQGVLCPILFILLDNVFPPPGQPFRGTGMALSRASLMERSLWGASPNGKATRHGTGTGV